MIHVSDKGLIQNNPYKAIRKKHTTGENTG